jgi:methyl-accepting chemotaxis protein
MGVCERNRPAAMLSWQASGAGALDARDPEAHVSNQTQRDSTGQSLLRLMVGAGILLGLVSPIVASLFVDFRGGLETSAFVALCVFGGAALGLFCWWVARRTSERVLMDVLREAGSALNVTTEASSGIDGTRVELVRVFGNVTTLLGQMRQVNSRLRGLASDILAASEQQVAGAAEQAAAVTQTSATLEELAQTSKQIAENSEAVVRVAERTLASAEEGMTAVAETANGIEEIRVTTMQSSDRILQLGERSQEIGRVLSIIDEIAEQTKILALNAAIEAARAGESGKGFAVVAGEIRKLADSVTESTSEIGRVVREIQASTSSLVMATEKASKKVDEGKAIAGRTADALDRIVQQVEETTDAAKQISIATQQQRSASDQVVVAMREVAQVSQQQAAAARQVSSSVGEMNTLADSLITG